MIEIIGRLHPLIVHLPIGCLLLAALFAFLHSVKKLHDRAAIGIALFVGMASAFFACISGYLLSDGHEASTTMDYHKWLGFATFGLSLMVWLAFRFQKKYTNALIYLLAILVSTTAHFGGSLTHGEDYLFPQKKSAPRKTITDINNALVYEDIIAPILSDKCYNCHSSSRQKGKLRLDEYTMMLKGGKHGPSIVANQSLKSLLVQRTLLPLNDDNHMPPKGKPQPSADELMLIQWWIDNGASTNKKTSDYTQNDKIKSILAHLTTSKKQEPILPVITSIPDPSAVKFLNDSGVSLQPLAQSSKLLLVNFIAHDAITTEDIVALNKIKDHVYILKLGHCSFDKKMLEYISSFKNLHALYLEKTGITDESCSQLAKLPSLHYLNVVGNKLTLTGIKTLCNIRSLQKIFVFQNSVTQSEIEQLAKEHPDLNIVGGFEKLWLTY